MQIAWRIFSLDGDLLHDSYTQLKHDHSEPTILADNKDLKSSEMQGAELGLPQNWNGENMDESKDAMEYDEMEGEDRMVRFLSVLAQSLVKWCVAGSWVFARCRKASWPPSSWRRTGHSERRECHRWASSPTSPYAARSNCYAFYPHSGRRAAPDYHEHILLLNAFVDITTHSFDAELHIQKYHNS